MGTSKTICVDALEDGGVLRILLNQPKANVLTTAMLQELRGALHAHASDQHLRLVILRGAGGTFSFGASIEEHRPDRVAPMLRTFHDTIRDIAAFPIPVAALVEGRCLGGAFELALCCHLVFAAPDARFACPEIKLGVFPPVLAAIGAYRLPGALAEFLLLTGSELKAEDAARAGFATLVTNADAQTAVLDWYRTTLAPLSAAALRIAVSASRRRSGLIDALRNGLDAAEQQYLADVLATHDGNEGIEAFLARRAPQWQDA